MLGMANSDKDDNGTQFFFTMAPTPELQGKNTLFGKVTGNTVFNMLKLEECLVDHNERPLHPPRIIKTEVLNNPFEDIVIRVPIKSKDKQKTQGKKEKVVKNFGLLSFGDEAEDDEAQVEIEKQKFSKSKSSHDALNDPKLSKESLKITASTATNDLLPEDNKLDKIREKLNTKSNSKDNPRTKNPSESSDDEDHLKTIEQEKQLQMIEQKKAIQEEIVSLKKQYKRDKTSKIELLEEKSEKEIEPAGNELIKGYVEEQQQYAEKQKLQIPRNNTDRETQTILLLQKFRSKLNSIRDQEHQPDVDNAISHEKLDEQITTDGWLNHKLSFKEDVTPVLAKDASTKNDDWYDAYDPRNTLNKRKRGEASTNKSKDESKRNRH